ncbi:MAG: formate transporter FocA [Chloroflexi bacterium]|nr:formate transporter FocA [Chloroflexota bacterium]
MAVKAEDMGVKKATMDVVTMFSLAILAGAFVAMGAVFATTVGAGSISVNASDGALVFRTGLPYGIVRLLMGVVFSMALILVIVAGAELFTGNNLIVMAFASGKVTLKALLKNWGVVYAGNFVGAISTALLIFLTKQYTFGNGAVGLTALSTAESKTSLEFLQAIALGIACNALVCLAVWLCLSARSTTDRILAIIPPITAFVTAGFEHSVANMYFIPFALLVKYFGDPKFFGAIGKVPEDFPHLTMTNFLVGNLLPVTVGNIIGGTVFVGLVYWFIYRRLQ